MKISEKVCLSNIFMENRSKLIRSNSFEIHAKFAKPAFICSKLRTKCVYHSSTLKLKRPLYPLAGKYRLIARKSLKLFRFHNFY